MKTILLLLFLITGAIGRENESELIFIYNAKCGLVNEFLDFAHKIFLVPTIVTCVQYHTAIFQ